MFLDNFSFSAKEVHSVHYQLLHDALNLRAITKQTHETDQAAEFWLTFGFMTASTQHLSSLCPKRT